MTDAVKTKASPAPTITPVPGTLGVIAPTPNLPAVIPAPALDSRNRVWLRVVLLVAATLTAAGGSGYWWLHRIPGLSLGFASGNGRLEADEIDIDTKFAGRIASLEVDGGDVVEASQTFALMDS